MLLNNKKFPYCNEISCKDQVKERRDQRTETSEKLLKSKITAKPLLKSDKPLLPTGSECESMGRWTTCGLRLNT